MEDIEAAERVKWDFSLDPEADVPPDQASIRVGSVRVAKGMLVRLRPGRRADSFDLFLKGRLARVNGVYRDVDDEAYVAVALDGGPTAEIAGWYGRLLYFYPDEIEPVADDTAEGGRS